MEKSEETAKDVIEGLNENNRYEMRGEEQNREEGEMAQTKLGGGRNRGKK